MAKFCAFGFWYQDSKGEILEESENYYIVNGSGWGPRPIAVSKTEGVVFDTEEEVDQWIKDQNYQYDSR